MPDLRDRFSLADEIDPRDLWGEARRRAAAPEVPSRALGRRPATGRRIVAAAVALAVFATAAVFAWDLSHPDLHFGPDPSPAVVDLASELPEGWSELPAPPEVRSGAATVWTGSQLLVWGGYEYTGYSDESSQADGFVFDAASRTWREFPSGPLEARSFAGTAWTGSEFLVWGGYGSTHSFSGGFSDGAAYDPETRSWSLLPEAPINGRAPLSVWTGEEFIVWGTAIRAGKYLDGAAYDPTMRSWRRIADGPIELTDATAAWTGDEMIVFGAALDGSNHSDTPTAVGAAYDPEADTWRELPPSELSPQAHTAEWLNGELIAWDYEHGTAAYDPNTNTWRALPRVPLSFGECGPDSAATAQFAFGNYCGQLALYSVAEDEWSDITPEQLRGWVLEPTAAGNAFLVMGHSLELSDETGEKFDRTMLAYVPSQPPIGEQIPPFLPSSEFGGGETRMPIVFPDGSRATLVFPNELGLEELGVQPDVSYLYSDDAGPEGRFEVIFLHDPDASIATYVEGSEPITTIGGGAEIWAMSEKWDARNQVQGAWIRLRLESWTVLVASTKVEDAVSVADYLRVRETSTGFPIVEAVGPLALAERLEGPALSIADTLPDPEESPRQVIFLSLAECNGSEADELPYYRSSCLAEGNVFARIYGDRAFLASVVEGLVIEDFRAA